MKILLIATLISLTACAKPKDGKNGADGSRGAQGAQGEPGTDGTVVQPVPLCPSIAGSFPEYLIYIDGRPYALYYDNTNPRLTEVTPGVYRTIDGRNCNFRITNDYRVEYL